MLLLAGCATTPWPFAGSVGAQTPANYLVMALAADPKEREALWQAAQHDTAGEMTSLHRALLRSIPGSAIYDPVAAESALQDLLTHDPRADVAQVARARLADLHAIAACRSDVDDLKRRLSKVADIEKRLDRERH
jgi:hypothetical protein